MDVQTIRRFFDTCAPNWDNTSEHDTKLIAEILDHAEIGAGMDVLDVACGTGVLFPDYLARKVGSLTAVDLSPEMVQRAQKKCPDAKVLCGNADAMDFGRTFDAIMIYNAFPHFLDPEQLLKHLKKFLKPNGTFTVAHGMSREVLQKHHAEHAGTVSLDLPTIEEMSALFSRYFTVVYAASDDRMYEIVGKNTF